MTRCDRCVWVITGARGGAFHQRVTDVTDEAADTAHMEQILLLCAENSLRHSGGMGKCSCSPPPFFFQVVLVFFLSTLFIFIIILFVFFTVLFYQVLFFIHQIFFFCSFSSLFVHSLSGYCFNFPSCLLVITFFFFFFPSSFSLLSNHHQILVLM